MYPLNKEVLIILPQNKFQDEEFIAVKSQLDLNNIKCTITACSDKIAIGLNGTQVEPDCVIDDVDIINYVALILIGGVGSIEHWHNRKVIDLIKDANKAGLYICAICLAPVTLANAGILKDKKATVYYSAASYLESKGVIITGDQVEESENIITANGPEASVLFSQAIIKSLKGVITNQTRSSI